MSAGAPAGARKTEMVAPGPLLLQWGSVARELLRESAPSRVALVGCVGALLPQLDVPPQGRPRFTVASLRRFVEAQGLIDCEPNPSNWRCRLRHSVRGDAVVSYSPTFRTGQHPPDRFELKLVPAALACGAVTDGAADDLTKAADDPLRSPAPRVTVARLRDEGLWDESEQGGDPGGDAAGTAEDEHDVPYVLTGITLLPAAAPATL